MGCFAKTNSRIERTLSIDRTYFPEPYRITCAESRYCWQLENVRERRQYFCETDKTVNLRLKAAQRYGLIPILCVGETKQQRDAGETESLITSQLEKDLVDVDQQNLAIAYEPIYLS